MSAKIQNYINHIAFVIDESGSMFSLREDVIKVFDEEIARLSKRSQQLNQETRVSIYTFSSNVSCLVYDMDVMRLPSLKDIYSPGGSTALIDATLQATHDLKRTPELYADHAFLLFVITDGEENASANPSSVLKRNLDDAPEHWTFACFVPDKKAYLAAVSYGFPKQNVLVWDISRSGFKKLGETVCRATESFMTNRAKGIRGTKTLFELNTTNLEKKVVKGILEELRASEFLVLNVHRDSVIKPFVESWTQESYRSGSAYYQLMKPETVQNYKQICVQEKKTGRVYTGASARNLLGLPDYEVKVNPASHPNWNVFIQSTSVNRKLPAGTQLIVMK